MVLRDVLLRAGDVSAWGNHADEAARRVAEVLLPMQEADGSWKAAGAGGVDAGVSHGDGDAEFGGEVPFPSDLSAVSAGGVLR